ncbi:protein of unknown function DUF901 [Paenibacillus curdlanolyticus YK9]|uniref:NYN domain-containing protein n=1 Tax=Paenibacillus curdlanolyticus YK9 TaxID=717606 RepID=E0I8K6_9BACL|nr:NYN domain-containing protein [Paenibacillus curdlanolyticus]EFM11511.1 protein of unknown function DUF901 [Paenibacillus curdlanolyticus YK9]
MSRRGDVLLVDGYNVIGAWPVLQRLRDHDLEDARDALLDMLADYQGFTGMHVYVVFDAHQVPGLGAKYKQHEMVVVYTKEKETADECIERLVVELTMRGRNIYVATSDMTEQHVAFGKGALRLSARELLIDIGQKQKQIQATLKEAEIRPVKRNTVDGSLTLDVRARLEKWRRGDL